MSSSYLLPLTIYAEDKAKMMMKYFEYRAQKSPIFGKLCSYTEKSAKKAVFINQVTISGLRRVFKRSVCDSILIALRLNSNDVAVR